MPLEYSISKPDQMVRVTATGKTDLADAVKAISGMTEDPAYSPYYRVLADLARMEDCPSASDLGAFGSALSGMGGSFRNRIALIVRRSLYYLASLACLSANSAGLEMAAFVEKAAAESWLLQGRKEKTRSAA